jgi:hypothetical protein
LAEVLEDDGWPMGNFQAEHVALACSITNAFRSLEGTFASSALPKCSSFLFYGNAAKKGKERAPSAQGTQQREETVPPNKDVSALSKLSLASGFGAPAASDTSSLWDLTQQTTTPSIVVALGLILYQIGSWKHLTYEMNSHEVNKARDQAMLEISAVDQYLPGEFTATVDACLRWKEDGLNSISTAEMIQRVATSLRNYESEIRSRF